MGTITEDNFLVWNQGKNPVVNFNFMLRVELLFDLPCKSVRAFTRELEYEYIQEGGLNDYVHMKRKPITKPFTLEVERYVGVDYVDPMPLGADLALPVLLMVGRAPNQFIPFLVARTYVFTGCTVMKKVYGDLVGDQSGLLLETTTIGYREMLCIDIPWSAVKTDVGVEYATPATNTLAEEARLAEYKRRSAEALAAAKAAQADMERYRTEATDVRAQLDALPIPEGETAEAATARIAAWDEKLTAMDELMQTGKTSLTAAEASDKTVQAAAKAADAASPTLLTEAESGKVVGACQGVKGNLGELKRLLPAPENDTEDPEAAARRAAALEERRAKAAAAEAERQQQAQEDAAREEQEIAAALAERRAKAAAAQEDNADETK